MSIAVIIHAIDGFSMMTVFLFVGVVFHELWNKAHHRCDENRRKDNVESSLAKNQVGHAVGTLWFSRVKRREDSHRHGIKRREKARADDFA